MVKPVGLQNPCENTLVLVFITCAADQGEVFSYQIGITGKNPEEHLICILTGNYTRWSFVMPGAGEGQYQPGSVGRAEAISVPHSYQHAALNVDCAPLHTHSQSEEYDIAQPRLGYWTSDVATTEVPVYRLLFNNWLSWLACDLALGVELFDPIPEPSFSQTATVEHLAI